MTERRAFETMTLARELDTLAPDGSEIRLLLALGGGSVVHCTLPPGGVSRAVRHRTVEEVWYILGGRGEVWRKQDGREAVVQAAAGVCLSIPLGTGFQFRTLGDEPLTFLIATMPPWPGPDEAERVADHWPTA
jgi:mannose-6-phosphate isomerase-like protein (cupin superfamily)